MDLDTFLDKFNWISRVEGLVSGILHFDRRKAGEGPPVLGFAAELLVSATPAGSWTFHIARNGGWTGGDAERLLNHYGIPIWGRRLTGDHFILTVPRRQANWAEYLLLRRGMCLGGRLFNPDNQRHARRFAPGDQPPAWADRGRVPATDTPPARAPHSRSALDRLGDLL